MKQIVEIPMGSSGGKAGLSVSEGNLLLSVATPMGKGSVTVEAAYPVVEVLNPIKVNFVDKLKALIPGTWDDVLIDKAWAEAVASLGEAPAALAAPMVDVTPKEEV